MHTVSRPLNVSYKEIVRRDLENLGKKMMKTILKTVDRTYIIPDSERSTTTLGNTIVIKDPGTIPHFKIQYLLKGL